jgi:hypothetical protein
LILSLVGTQAVNSGSAVAPVAVGVAVEGGVLGAAAVLDPAALVVAVPDACPQPNATITSTTTAAELRYVALMATVLRSDFGELHDEGGVNAG